MHRPGPRPERLQEPVRRRGHRGQAAGQGRAADPEQAAELAAVLAGLPRLTLEEVEAGRSPAGGFTYALLAAWGVPWPRPPGWLQALLRGQDTDADPLATDSPGGYSDEPPPF